MSFSGVVGVTGATSGIGRATALHLAERGIPVFLVGRRTELLDSMETTLTTLGAEVGRMTADLSGSKGQEQACQGAMMFANGRRLSWVNAAGIARFGSFHERDLSDAEDQIHLMLSAPIALTHTLLPYLLAHEGGRFVNVLSIAATHVFPGAAAYSAAKAGLLAFGRSLNAEYRARGVTTISILPGATDTEIWDGPGGSPPRDQMLTAKAVAEAIVWALTVPDDRVIEELTITPPLGIL